MLDLIAALTLTAIFVGSVIVLVGLAPVRPVTKFLAFLITAAWATMIVMVAAWGGFAPGATKPFPALLLVLAIPVVGGLVAWFLAPNFRNALLGLPLAALIGINAGRLAGIFFLLFAQGRLAAPSAFASGAGDILVALAALPLVALTARGRTPSPRVLAAWNALGVLELIVAITLGVLSSPGTPLPSFMNPASTAVMTRLPWAVITPLLVPLYLLTHLTLAGQLQRATPPFQQTVTP